MMYWLVERCGIVGAAYAFAAAYALYTAAMLWATRVLIGFSWSTEARRLILASAAFVAAAFAARLFSSDLASLILGAAVALAGALFSLRGLAGRLGNGHRLVKWAQKAPGGQFLLGGITSASRPQNFGE
jgi:O-antigen/teichoic acid export membrane protein